MDNCASYLETILLLSTESEILFSYASCGFCVDTIYSRNPDSIQASVPSYLSYNSTLRANSFSSKSTLWVSRLASVEAMLPRMKPNRSFPNTITRIAYTIS